MKFNSCLELILTLRENKNLLRILNFYIFMRQKQIFVSTLNNRETNSEDIIYITKYLISLEQVSQKVTCNHLTVYFLIVISFLLLLRQEKLFHSKSIK